MDAATTGRPAREETGGAGPRPATALRFALREMRGGLRGFYVFIACIALGVGTIAGVGSLASALGNGIAAEGQTILGGDASFALIHRRASGSERAFLRRNGAVSEIATLRAMARRPESGSQTLVEVKAVDAAYPLYGKVELQSGRPLHEVIGRAGDGTWKGVVDPALLATQNLAVGDTFALGRITVTVADTIASEPDRLSSGLEFGPRVMLPIEALTESGLVQPGSLVRWHYRVRGLNGPMGRAELKALVAAAQREHPKAGWRVRTREAAAPGLQRSIGQFAQFLTLVGLTGLVVGGVGVANAVRAYLEKKRAVIGTLRSLGGSGDFVVRLYFLQILMLAAVGIAIGVAVGTAIPPLAGRLLQGLLPVKALFGVFPLQLGLATIYGGMTAVTFALWPLGRAHDIPPTALFRDATGRERGEWPRRRYIVATVLAAGLLSALAVWFAYDRQIALIHVGAAIAAFALLRLVATLVMGAARRAPRPRSAVVRLALSNIHRGGALTPTVVLSLGLSLTLLVALALIDGNLRRTLTSRLPAEAPSFFFVDIQNRELGDFLALLAREAPGAEVAHQPMLRGRIVAINGIPAAEYPAGEAAWVLRGDRGITYAEKPPANGRIVAGKWWDGDGGDTPQVSFAAGLARELGLSIGDTVTVNVLGREVDAQVTNFRTVEWETLAINFVMMFSPNTFAGAPHAHLATLTWPGGASDDEEIALLRKVASAFPTITAIRVKDALEQINDVVGNIALAIRAAAGVTLLASVLVLAGTLAATQRSRIYDAVILKTLGATRGKLVGAFGLEYAILGLATAVFGVVAGAIAAWFVLTNLMEIDFEMLPGAAVGAVAAALAVTLGLGLVGTWRALGEKPAPVLRNL